MILPPGEFPVCYRHFFVWFWNFPLCRSRKTKTQGWSLFRAKKCTKNTEILFSLGWPRLSGKKRGKGEQGSVASAKFNSAQVHPPPSPLQHATNENRSCTAIFGHLRCRSCTATFLFLQYRRHIYQKLSSNEPQNALQH